MADNRLARLAAEYSHGGGDPIPRNMIEKMRQDIDMRKAIEHGQLPAAIRLPEEGLAGGVPTVKVGGMEVSPLDFIGPGEIAKAFAFAKAAGVSLGAALAATGVASRASAGAVMPRLAGALEGQRGIFAGVKAKTADMAKLEDARAMQAAGVSDRDIHAKTGWFFGSADKQPRFEISDNLAKYDPESLSELKINPGFNYKKDTQPLAGVVEHNQLYNAYPDAENIPVHFMPQENLRGAFGAYTGKHDRITLGDALTPENYTPSALHEIQHAVQKREGFAEGGSNVARNLVSQEDAYQAYRRLAGEAEARLTQMRMGLTPDQRAAIYPLDMLDVPVEQQIVRQTSPELAMSVPEESYRGAHTAPKRNEGSPLHDLTSGELAYPGDIYSKNAAQYYRTGDHRLDRDTIKLMHDYKNKPDATVVIYRAVPKNVPENININPGDWVTINPDYAKMHGESVLKGDYKIIKKEVKASDIFTDADSIHEFGYDPQIKTPNKSIQEKTAMIDPIISAPSRNLYRGLRDPHNPSRVNPVDWYSENQELAKVYGDHMITKEMPSNMNAADLGFRDYMTEVKKDDVLDRVKRSVMDSFNSGRIDKQTAINQIDRIENMRGGNDFNRVHEWIAKNPEIPSILQDSGYNALSHIEKGHQTYGLLNKMLPAPAKTEFELAHDAAQLDAYLKHGLPENNTAMDRAKAMGFDTPAYHGGTNDFMEFSSASPIYATNNPTIADIYANAESRHKSLRNINASPNVMPLLLGGKELKVSDLGDGGHGWLGDNLATALGVQPKRKLVNELPLFGYDRMTAQNMIDLGGDQLQYIMPSKSNVIRSRFAAFNMSTPESSNLLAGAAVPLTGLAAYALQNPEETY